MSTLSQHIKGQPHKSLGLWARDFGISRPYLYALIDGSRNPSLEVAQRIATATCGEVPLESWPNLSAIIDAAGGAMAVNHGDAASAPQSKQGDAA